MADKCDFSTEMDVSLVGWGGLQTSITHLILVTYTYEPCIQMNTEHSNAYEMQTKCVQIERRDMEEKWKPHPTRENIFKVGGCLTGGGL